MGDIYKSSFISVVVGFVGSLISAYLFSIGRLEFEEIFWIIIGLVVFVGIMIYREIVGEFKDMNWELKRLDEKFKIYDRLRSVEEIVKND